MVQQIALRLGYLHLFCVSTCLVQFALASPTSSINPTQPISPNQSENYVHPHLPIPPLSNETFERRLPNDIVNASSNKTNPHYSQSTVIDQDPISDQTTLKTFSESLPLRPNSQPLTKPSETPLPPSSAQVVQVQDLLRLNSDLEEKLHSLRIQKSRAIEELHQSKSLEATLRSQHSHLHQSSEETRQELDALHHRLPRYQDTLKILKSQATDAIRQIETLRTRKFYLLQRLRNLEDNLRERGLERWVGERVKDSVNPLVADALMHGTASIVEPVLDGFERIAEIEEELEGRMKGQLRQRVPLVDNPFYSGFVTYLVLLTPVVLVLSILARLRRSLAKMGLLHVIVLVNFYFAVMCAGCFGATLFGHVDVLLTLRALNKHIFDGIMLLHGVLYATHVLCHVVLACRTRSHSAGAHVVALAAVGMHFFIHSWRHAMRHEDPHVDRHAYVVYSAIFGFVLYELTVKRVKDEQEKRVMTLNNSSIVGMANVGDSARVQAASVKEGEIPGDRMSLV